MKATLLLSHEDVATAAGRPGFYVVQAGSEAYFPAMALVEQESAKLVGETYPTGGRVATILVGEAVAAIPNPAPERRTITIGREFFITALKDYNDWPIKWWREAIQNSVDAGATEIKLTSSKNADETYTVACEDNGRGMDEDTIINKFLVLGATTKTLQSGAAGGFGKAKELLLLPWISWKIHSRSTVVFGSGIDYEASQIEERVGTKLEVVMPADKHTDEAYALAFVQKCYLPGIQFLVNDQPARADLSGDRVIEEIPDKAAIYFVPIKGETQSYIYVRARGLYMFSTYMGEVPGYLLAEILAPSIEILTANRDSFRQWDVEHAIRKLGERIAKDNMSALRAGRGLIRKKYQGMGKFETRSRTAETLGRIGPYVRGGVSKSDIEAVTHALDAYSRDEERKISTVASPAIARAMLDQKFLGPDHLEAAIKQLVWEPDFYLVNEIDGYKVPERFFPETMTPTILKLAKVWAELCRYVLVQLGSTEEFGVGFIFSEQTAAAAIDEDRESWLMLNPFKDLDRKKETWRTTDADLKWLYAAAIHEATHVADRAQYHDEAFAAALTRNMARCADGYRKIKQIAAGIRMRGAPELR